MIHSFGVQIIAFAAPSPGQESPPPLLNLVPILLILVMLYVVLIRPQKKKEQEHSALLAKLKVGDKIITTGGIVGTVVSLKDKHIAIRSGEAKMEMLKNAVSEIVPKHSNTK